MKKRNLAAMGLAGVMAVGMCMPVMAEDTANDVTAAGDNQMKISMDVAEKYSVSIPSKIEFDASVGSKQLSFSMTDAPIVANNKAVTIKVDNAAVTLTSAEGATYGLKYSTTSDSTGALTDATSAIATFSNSSHDAKNIYLVSSDTVQYSGTYTGSTTFTIAVEEI